MAYLPVETIIRDRQEDYYRMLGKADTAADITPFIEYMLQALLFAIHEVITDQVSDQVARLLRGIGTKELSAGDLMKKIGLSHRPTFRKNYLKPALDSGWIERTQPDAPRSPTQRYRLTKRGLWWFRERK